MPPRDLIPFDLADPLRRQMGESAKANAAFRDYAMMGAGRSLRALHEKYIQLAANKKTTEKPITKSRNTIDSWSLKHSWVARSTRFDELEETRRIETWRERRLQLQEDDWEQGDKLRKLTDEMLAVANKYVVKGHSRGTPSVVDEKGNLISRGRPDAFHIALNASLLTRAAKLASDLQRLAAGEPTERTDVTSGGEAITIRVIHDGTDSKIA